MHHARRPVLHEPHDLVLPLRQVLPQPAARQDDRYRGQDSCATSAAGVDFLLALTGGPAALVGSIPRPRRGRKDKSRENFFWLSLVSLRSPGTHYEAASGNTSAPRREASSLHGKYASCTCNFFTHTMTGGCTVTCHCLFLSQVQAIAPCLCAEYNTFVQGEYACVTVVRLRKTCSILLRADLLKFSSRTEIDET